MASDATAAARERPELECDIVMAGGVTSGIIYPGAVEQISRRYVFRSIGGTSVGAIAAAITAAAEYGRLTGRNPLAFKTIATMPARLGAKASDGHSRLFHLFTPEPETKRLYAFIMPLFSGGSWPIRLLRMASKTLSTLPVVVAILTALVIGGVLGVATVRSVHPNGAAWLFGIVAFVGTLLLVALAWAATTLATLAKWWLPALVDNRYGLCSGLADPSEPPDAAGEPFLGLTNWLHREVQTAAGRTAEDAPLTFGDLWGAPLKADAPIIPGLDMNPASPRAIELAMIASDISRNRNAQLPFLEMQSPVYVAKSTLARCFPPVIVDWMVANAGTYDKRAPSSDDLIRLPDPRNLPIVFGARLSLSFPILLSAMPLLTTVQAKDKDGTWRLAFRPVWYSDGGLISNFPIHFFDGPIPSRPTFCLNLVDFGTATEFVETPGDEADGEVASARAPKALAEPRGAGREAEPQAPPPAPGDPVPGDRRWGLVDMPEGNRALPVQFTEFQGGGLAPFLSTLLNTARFWSDNELLVAPGVRERVVNIGLRRGEGGLNLDMTAETIGELDWRGKAAGQLIAARFDPKAAADPETGKANVPVFAGHRWVRYRNFMAAFEDLTRRFAASRRQSDVEARRRGERQLDEMIDGDPKTLGYPAPVRARAYYHSTTDALENLALAMATARRADPFATFDRTTDGSDRPRGAAPRPKMRFRLRPIANDDPRLAHADLPPEPPPAIEDQGHASGAEGGTGA